MRPRKQYSRSRQRCLALCRGPAFIIIGRERAKRAYFWRHAYVVPRSGSYLGCVVNADTGKPVIVDESRLTVADFERAKISETIDARGKESCPRLHSALWQADTDRIRRRAPITFIDSY